jgi:hypothetical protein
MAVRARTTAKPTTPLLTLRWTLSAKRLALKTSVGGIRATLPARSETRHQNGRRCEAGGKLNPWSSLPLETVIPFRDFGQQALPARSRRHWAEPFRACRIGLARGRKRLPPQSNLKGGIWPRPRRGLFSMKSSHRTINQVLSNRWGAARRPPRPATSSDRAHRRTRAPAAARSACGRVESCCTATNDETDMELVAVSFVAEWPQKPEIWIDGPVRRPWRWPRSDISGKRALTYHLASLAERLARSIRIVRQSPRLGRASGASSSHTHPKAASGECQAEPAAPTPARPPDFQCQRQ